MSEAYYNNENHKVPNHCIFVLKDIRDNFDYFVDYALVDYEMQNRAVSNMENEIESFKNVLGNDVNLLNIDDNDISEAINYAKERNLFKEDNIGKEIGEFIYNDAMKWLHTQDKFIDSYGAAAEWTENHAFKDLLKDRLIDNWNSKKGITNEFLEELSDSFVENPNELNRKIFESENFNNRIKYHKFFEKEYNYPPLNIYDEYLQNHITDAIRNRYATFSEETKEFLLTLKGKTAKEIIKHHPQDDKYDYNLTLIDILQDTTTSLYLESLEYSKRPLLICTYQFEPNVRDKIPENELCNAIIQVWDNDLCKDHYRAGEFIQDKLQLNTISQLESFDLASKMHSLIDTTLNQQISEALKLYNTKKNVYSGDKLKSLISETQFKIKNIENKLKNENLSLNKSNKTNYDKFIKETKIITQERSR